MAESQKCPICSRTIKEHSEKEYKDCYNKHRFMKNKDIIDTSTDYD